MPPPGRAPTQTLDRSVEPDPVSSADLPARTPAAVGAPPTVDTVAGLTAGGNAAVSRAVSGGMSVDPLMSTMDGEEAVDAGVPAAGVADVATTDAPPDGGPDGGSGTGSGTGSGSGSGGPDGGDAGAPGDGGARDGGVRAADGGPGTGQIPGGDSTGGGTSGPLMSGGGPISSGPANGPVQTDVGPMSVPDLDGTPVNAGASGLTEEAPVVGPAGIDPVLVDDELAEHERWGSAAAAVGASGSAERAGFIAEQVGAGLGEGALTGAAAGVVLSITTRAASRLAVRHIPVPIVGSIIGGAIGAMSLVGQLGAEGRAQLAAKFSAFGEGASGYEVAANTIDAIVTGLDLAGNILDTVALIAGVVAAVALALALPTLGASLAVATPAGSIATGASAASAILGAVKMILQPMVLLFRALHTFTSDADPRAVQALGGKLASDAGAVGGVLGGFAGSAVGNRASDKLGLPADPTRATRTEETAGEGGARVSAHPEGPTVEAVPGEGAVLPGRPAVEAVPGGSAAVPGGPATAPELRRVLTEEEFRIADAQRANPNPVLVGADNKPLRPAGSTGTVYGPAGEVANRSVVIDTTQIDPADVEFIPGPGYGRSSQYEPSLPQLIVPGYAPAPPKPGDPNPARPLTRFDPEPTYGEFRAALTRVDDPNVPRNLIVMPGDPAPAPQLGYGYGRLYDAQGNIVPDQFGPFRGELGQPIRDPETGQLSWDPESRFEPPQPGAPGYGPDPNRVVHGVRAGPGGGWVDHNPNTYGPTEARSLAAAQAHAADEAALGPAAINNRRALPTAWPLPYNHKPGDVPTDENFGAGLNVYPIQGPTYGIGSVVAPQPEGAPQPGRQSEYPGGGPQFQIPYGTLSKTSTPESFHSSAPPAPVGPVAPVAPPVPVAPVAPVSSAEPVAPAEPAPVGPRWAQTINDGFVGTMDNANDSASLGSLAAGGDSPGAARRVEPVNPAYERPPGTPEELARMRREIGALMVSRTQADADAEAARADQAETARRARQLMSVDTGVGELARRTDEQQADVAATGQANEQQQGRQEQAGTAFGASASRLTGLATMEALLGGFVGVTAGAGWIASLFSDDAAAKMYKLSGDGRRFMAQLAQARMMMSTQAGQQPLQMGRLTGDATAIGAEGQRTEATGASVDRSRQQVTALGAQNTQDAAAAGAAEQRAQRDSTDADSAANDIQARHDQLAADLEAWAQRHRDQRQQAVAQTRARLEAEGWVVTGESEW